MKMKRYLYMIFLPAMLPLLSMLASCSSDGPDAAEMEEKGKSYLQLDLRVTGSGKESRAVPAPGENGDGLEGGIRNENKIYDLNLFIYEDAGEGLDSPDNTPVLFHTFIVLDEVIEVNPQTGKTVYVAPLGDYKPEDGKTYRVVVVANAGNLTPENLTTLGALRRRPATKAWLQPGDNILRADNFMMATAFNGAKWQNKDEDRIIKISDTGTRQNPNYRVVSSIERVAARIDMEVDPSNITDATLKYTVEGGNVDAPSTLDILNAVPVNLMSEPSYQLKHVTPGRDLSSLDNGFAGLLVCGEEAVSDNLAANYVVSPNFLTKRAAANLSSLNLKGWFGNSAADEIRKTFPVSDHAMNKYVKYAEENPSDASKRIITLAYSNENTQPMDKHDYRLLTGIAFRAVFHPGKIWTDGECTVEADREGKGTGDKEITFYCYRAVKEDMSEKNCIYFSTLEAAKAYQAKHPVGEVIENPYQNGVCYYNIWLRHASNDSDPHITNPMEYGIVRNNIYRFSLEFVGIGSPVPEIRKPENIVSRLFVIKWNFRLQDEIVM